MELQSAARAASSRFLRESASTYCCAHWIWPQFPRNTSNRRSRDLLQSGRGRPDLLLCSLNPDPSSRNEQSVPSAAPPGTGWGRFQSMSSSLGNPPSGQKRSNRSRRRLLQLATGGVANINEHSNRSVAVPRKSCNRGRRRPLHGRPGGRPIQ